MPDNIVIQDFEPHEHDHGHCMADALHEAERVCAPEALKGVELGGEGGCAHVEDEEGGLCRSCVEIEPVGIVKSEDAAACDRASGAAHGLLDRDGSLDGTNHPNGPALALKGRIRAFRRSRL